MREGGGVEEWGRRWRASGGSSRRQQAAEEEEAETEEEVEGAAGGPCGAMRGRAAAGRGHGALRAVPAQALRRPPRPRGRAAAGASRRRVRG